MRYKCKAKVHLVEQSKNPPLLIEFDCPVCGNPISFVIRRKDEEITDWYSDASEVGDHLVQCGMCESILAWNVDKPKNPSERK